MTVVRAGQTNKPIPTTSGAQSVQVLHAILRTFDHFMKTVVYVKAGVYDWSESSTNAANRFIKQAKLEIQKALFDHTGIKWDYPDATGKGGTTTTGNVARELLHKTVNRTLVIEQ